MCVSVRARKKRTSRKEGEEEVRKISLHKQASKQSSKTPKKKPTSIRISSIAITKLDQGRDLDKHL